MYQESMRGKNVYKETLLVVPTKREVTRVSGK